MEIPLNFSTQANILPPASLQQRILSQELTILPIDLLTMKIELPIQVNMAPTIHTFPRRKPPTKLHQCVVSPNMLSVRWPLLSIAYVSLAEWGPFSNEFTPRAKEDWAMDEHSAALWGVELGLSISCTAQKDHDCHMSHCKSDCFRKLLYENSSAHALS